MAKLSPEQIIIMRYANEAWVAGNQFGAMVVFSFCGLCVWGVLKYLA